MPQDDDCRGRRKQRTGCCCFRYYDAGLAKADDDDENNNNHYHCHYSSNISAFRCNQDNYPRASAHARFRISIRRTLRQTIALGSVNSAKIMSLSLLPLVLQPTPPFFLVLTTISRGKEKRLIPFFLVRTLQGGILYRKCILNLKRGREFSAFFSSSLLLFLFFD